MSRGRLDALHNVVRYFCEWNFAVSSYVSCCFGFGLLLHSDGTSRTVYRSLSGGEACGITLDSRACVLLLEMNFLHTEVDWEARLLVINTGGMMRSRELLRVRDGSLAVRYRLIVGCRRFSARDSIVKPVARREIYCNETILF